MIKPSFTILLFAFAVANPLFANQIILKILDNRPLEEISYLGSDHSLLNQFDYSGNAPIHVAVCSNRYDVIAWLAENGANLIVPNDLGFTPLDLALNFGQDSAIETLLLFIPRPAYFIKNSLKKMAMQLPWEVEEIILKTLLARTTATYLMRNAAYESMLVLKQHGLPPSIYQKIAMQLLDSSNLRNYLKTPWTSADKLKLATRWLRVGYELNFDKRNKMKNRQFDELSDVIQYVFKQRISHDLPYGDEPDETDAANIVSFLEDRLKRLDGEKSAELHRRAFRYRINQKSH